MTTAQALGKQAENDAQQYLEAQGLRYHASNYLCPHGEIDLIMWQADVLVFIEVRSRKPGAFASAAETVSISKQKKVRRSAEHFLQREKRLNNTPARFDVIAIDGSQMQWIQGAF